MQYKVQNEYLCNILWRKNSENVSNKVDLIMNTIKAEKNNYSEAQYCIIAKKLNNFIYHFTDKWKKCARNKEQFKNKYHIFLKNYFVVDLPDTSNNNLMKCEECPTKISSKGRPKKSFEEGFPKLR